MGIMKSASSKKNKLNIEIHNDVYVHDVTAVAVTIGANVIVSASNSCRQLDTHQVNKSLRNENKCITRPITQVERTNKKNVNTIFINVQILPLRLYSS